jgi:hypothetical protein
MERWESDFSGGVDEPDVPDSPEQRVDRFGVMLRYSRWPSLSLSPRFGF